MKKYVAILLAALLMSFCLSFTVSAEADSFTLSEDLMTLTWKGKSYVRMDTSCTTFYNCENIDLDPQLTPQQREQFIDWTFNLSEDGYMIDAALYYRTGGFLSCSYILEEFAPQLDAYQKADGVDCRIEIDLEPIIVPEARLKGQPTTLSGKTLEQANQYDVYADVTDEFFYISTGTLLIHQGKFYYVDHSEMTRNPGYFDPYEYETLDCYQITDEELCQKLNGLGLSEDDLEALLELGTEVLVVFIFGLVPAGILVLALVLLIKRKGYYKVTWGITAGFCVAELITFVTVLVNLNW